MATVVSCFLLLLVTVSCTTSQWSKPIPASSRRLSTLSEDWVPVASPCPTCPKEAKTKIVARQADPLLQPPPAYQPSAQSAYIQHTLSDQQREIQNHFNTQGLLPAFVQTPGQFFNEQFVTQQQTGASSQELVSPEVSHQQIPATQQLGSPQLNLQLLPPTEQLTSLPLNHQPISAFQQVSPLRQQLPSVTQQLTSPQPSHQQTAAAQQLVSPQLTYQQVSATQQPVSPKLGHQQISAAQHLVSPQPSQKHISATQLSNEQSHADKQPVSPVLNHKQQEVPQKGRRPPPSTTAPATQEEIQLLYVPVEALRQQQQAALLRQQQQQTKQLPISTTEEPSTTLEPYQPPLSVFMGQKHGHNVKISDVVKVLKESKTISVLDTVGPDSPQVFIGPSNLHTPEGYAKFELPYLSALESNNIERKVPKPPFFVAPLSFKPPAGYSKIPFPAPHVGSVVIGNVTENVIIKDHARKTYSLPAELPPINPQLPSLVNSLQDQRSIPLAPHNQEVTQFLQAVEQVGRGTTTERYSRTKLSRNPYENSDVTGIRQSLPTKQTSLPFQQPITRYQETTTPTFQPQYLQPVQENTRMPTHSAQHADIPKHQPSFSEFDKQSQLSQHGTLQKDISIRQPQTAVHNPTRQSQYQQEGIAEREAYTNSQKHIHETRTNQTKHRDGSYRTQNTAYRNLEDDSKKRQSQYLPSEVKVLTKQEANNGSPTLQYPRLESVIVTEQPQYTIPHQKIPTGQTQYSLLGINDPAKNTAIQQEISTPWPQNSEIYSEGTKYTTQDTIPRQTQYSVTESAARPSHLHTRVNDEQRQPQYSKPQESDVGIASELRISQEGILHRQPTNPVLEAAPGNAQHAIPNANIPREQQHSGLYVDAISKDYPPVQEEILLRPEGAEEQNHPVSRDESSQQIHQHPGVRTDVSQKHSKHPVHRGKIPSLHLQYQATEQTVTAKPNDNNPQEQIPSRITQYANSPDKFQSQYPILGSEVLTQSAVASTTTASSVRTTPSRGRNRGRYRPSSFSTTTPTSRTRSPYSRGRRPATRTTSEAPEVQAIAAGQVSPFESSRQPSERPQALRSDTQQRDKTRSRSRGSSTTTTTTSPQYNADLHQEDLYDHTPTQNAKTDTLTENFPNIISQRQQQAPSGQLTVTQFPNGQVGYTQPYSSQQPQSPSGQVQQNQFSNSQVSYTHLSSGLVSDVQIPYSQIPKQHVYPTHIPNAQNIPQQFSNINEAAQQVPIEQAPHTQNINDETSLFQVPNVETTHSRIPYGALDDAQTHNIKIAQNHVSGITESHNQNHAVQIVNYQVPTGKLRSNQILSEQPVNNQIPTGQAAQPSIPDDYHGHSASSTDGKQMSITSRTLSNTPAVSLQHDGFLQHELPELTEYTTQRQHSPLPHDKYRTLDVVTAYQTTFSPPTLDGKFREQGDSYIITTDKSAQDVGGDVTQKPSFVRLRGRVRARPRTVQQPTEKTATITTVSPEFQTTTVSRKHTNFINRGSARKTQAPTTTPAPETTTPLNDKIYTVRPSRRPQQSQTRLTTKGRIRRPTRPPATTTSSPTTSSHHRLNEVPDAFTTEVIPTTRGIQFALQPEYDTSQQYQPKRQPYQSIQRTREPLQQHQPVQHYQTTQRQQGTVQQYQPGQYYQSIPPSSQLPVQQYRPDEQQQDQQYLSVERSRVTDQIFLPSDNQPQYGFNDPESGEESQWSGRTQPFSSNNAVPNVTKSIATLLEVTTVGPERAEESDSTTETIVSTTEAATLMLTALPDISTTSERSAPGHSRRKGNWVRVRIRPQQQQDILETAESQNLATVAAANQIPGETAFKQITKGPSNEGVLGNYLPTSSGSHAESDDDRISKSMTESSNTRELLRHQEDSFNSHSVESYFKYENTTVDSDAKYSDNKNATEQPGTPTSSPTIQGYHESPDNTRKHVTEHSSMQDLSEVTSPSDKGYPSDEITTAKSEDKFTTTEDDFTNNDYTSEGIISSWLLPPSGLEDPWNQEEASEETEKSTTNQNDNATQNKTSSTVNSSWTLPSSNQEVSWNQNLSRMITKSVSTESDDSDSKATVSLADTTTPLPEGQDSYIGSLLSSLGYYGKPKHDSDKNRNWGVYEDWWAKTYANHRPYYTDEQLNLPEENEKKLHDSTSIWNMDSFKTYEDSNNPADDATRASNASLLNSTTAIAESITNVSSLEDYPHYQVWEDIDKNHHTAKHSVKKANPQNVYDKHVTIKDIEGEPDGSSIQDLLAAEPEDTLPVADIATTESSVDVIVFLDLSTEHSGLNLTESIPSRGNLKETTYRSVTTERNILSTSTEFVAVPSNVEHTFNTEHILEDENVVGTDKLSYSESKQTPLNTERSTESSVSLISEPNVKRTDTRSLMAKILGTTTSTKISHETEICYRGRCIKTKTKDSDIDQFSTE